MIPPVNISHGSTRMTIFLHNYFIMALLVFQYSFLQVILEKWVYCSLLSRALRCTATGQYSNGAESGLLP